MQAPDLQKLVNGLWQVGAEAISINGQRLTSLTAIREAGRRRSPSTTCRCGGPTRSRPIGNPKTDGRRAARHGRGTDLGDPTIHFGLLFDVNTKDSMLLPAAKRTALRSAHVSRQAAE